MRLGIFLPNWIGDVAMATPAIRALRKHVAGGELIAVMRPYVAEALGGNPWFDGQILYDKKSSAAAELQPPAVRQKLRDARFDAVVLLTNSLRTAWMAYRSGARQRIGMVGNLRTPLLTTRVYAPRKGRRSLTLPPTAGYLQIAYAAGASPEAPTLELFTTPADEQLADAVWKRLRLPSGDRVAVLNTGGAFGAAKDWPAAHFTLLALRLAREQGLHVVLNCGPAERQAVRNIVAEARDERIVSLAEEESLPLGLTKAMIRRARLLVTTDSGPRFFGVAFGVPTVALFGPTSVAYTRTGAAHDVGLSLGLDCQPCMARTCPLGHHRCMKDLSVERVWNAVSVALADARRVRIAA
ncbi:lipopolysaccharide heptosyltransferase II [Lacipirellula sp.]|uniref:lipopolysaccharide heptosyltransferase II n=1 Tax=Lacipirellula sp. TaxID=2691419 RepID=UPI003D10F89F